MKCSWQSLLNILPLRFRTEVDKRGRLTLQEFRLRLGLRPELVCSNGSLWLEDTVTTDDISFVVNSASGILRGRRPAYDGGISRHPVDIGLACAVMR